MFRDHGDDPVQAWQQQTAWRYIILEIISIWNSSKHIKISHWLCLLHSSSPVSSSTFAQAHLKAGSVCNLAGCMITDDWRPFTENIRSACSLVVHGCFTMTGRSAKVSPGTAHVQDVCLRYCQTQQPGDWLLGTDASCAWRESQKKITTVYS
jgi:hypothetical protein